MTLHTRTLPSPKRQYNVGMKMVRRTILYLWSFHYLADTYVKSYFTKSEIAFLREL